MIHIDFNSGQNIIISIIIHHHIRNIDDIPLPLHHQHLANAKQRLTPKLMVLSLLAQRDIWIQYSYIMIFYYMLLYEACRRVFDSTYLAFI